MKNQCLYIECVDVDTEIKFKLTIEDEIYSINEIEQSIRDFYKTIMTKWLVGFKETKGGRRFALEGGMPDVLNQNILFLELAQDLLVKRHIIN